MCASRIWGRGRARKARQNTTIASVGVLLPILSFVLLRSPGEAQRNPGAASKRQRLSRISWSLSSGPPLRAGPVGSIRATFCEGGRGKGHRQAPPPLGPLLCVFALHV